MKGVRDFDKEAGANAAESLLTEPESTAIEKELYALPAVSGMFNISSAVMEAVLNRHRQTAAIATAVAADLGSSPPAADTTEPPK